jgi:hypothetical protein
MVEVTSQSLNCNPDFVAAAVLAAASVAVGSMVKIQIKGGWLEGALLYIMIIGNPGSKKTPAIGKAIKPIYELHKALSEAYKNELKAWEENKEGEKPTPKGIVTTDVTLEALALLMHNHAHGILSHKDEAIAWLKSMNQYRGGKGSDMEKFLSFWSQSPESIDRVSKPPLFLEHPFLTFIGGLQPDILQDLSQIKNNGFLARNNFIFPVPIPVAHSDVEIPDALIQEYSSIIIKIYNYQQKLTVSKILKLTPDAQESWKQWHIEYCNSMNDQHLPFYMNEVMAKLEGYSLRYALILEHLWRIAEDKEVECISTESIERAIKLTAYFRSHADKVFSSFQSSSLDKQIEQIIHWLNKKGRNGRCGLRTLYTNHAGNVKNRDEALGILTEMHKLGIGTLSDSGQKQFGSNQPLYVFELAPKYLKPENKNGAT